MPDRDNNKKRGPRLGRLLRNIGSLEELSDVGGKGRWPPELAYDPAIRAEQRAAARGLLDTAQDTRISLRQGRQDLRTTLRDLATDLRRGRRDARIGLRRGLQDIGFERQDVRREGRREQQDLGLQMDALVRRFGQQGEAQRQAAAASGVYDAGTRAASEQARASNLAFARKPIDIAQRRVGQDVDTALGRLGTQAGRLRRDTRIGLRDLRQDVRHDRRLARRDFRRTRRGLYNSLERAIREQRIGNVDLLQQAIFDARSRAPGVYSKLGRKAGKD